jgi:tetratricopeptide (TPR) repeat protein
MTAKLSLAFVAAILLVSQFAIAEDLRDKYGTRNLKAAQALQRGMQLLESKRVGDALKAIKESLAHDPNFQLGYHWLAIAHSDFGQLDKASEAFARAIEIEPRTNIATDAAINNALLHIGLDDSEESLTWFTKAIVNDPTDTHGLHWKSYRNMAISQFNLGYRLAAGISVLNAKEAGPEHVTDEMVKEFLEGIGNDEGGQVLTLSGEIPELKPRPKQAFQAVPDVFLVDEKIAELFAHPLGKFVAVRCLGGHPHLVAWSPRNEAAKVGPGLSGACHLHGWAALIRGCWQPLQIAGVG